MLDLRQKYVKKLGEGFLMYKWVLFLFSFTALTIQARVQEDKIRLLQEAFDKHIDMQMQECMAHLHIPKGILR